MKGFTSSINTFTLGILILQRIYTAVKKIYDPYALTNVVLEPLLDFIITIPL